MLQSAPVVPGRGSKFQAEIITLAYTPAACTVSLLSLFSKYVWSKDGEESQSEPEV